MNKKRIVVIGANSQLGKTMQQLSFPDFDIQYTTKKELDITNIDMLTQFFAQHSFDYCLNFSAYTNVNQAEIDRDVCFAVNATGIENLVKTLPKETKLIHISTDFVFDGDKQNPYLETDFTNPLNYYGLSKLQGEQIIQKNKSNYYIIRTSWLYSGFNTNFVKTVGQLSQTHQRLSLVNDQIGTPTYALDLVQFISYLMQNDIAKFGLYHFSNLGAISWFDFGKKVLSLSNIQKEVVPIASNQFKSLAKRPKYSVLSKQKVVKILNYKVRDWEEALIDFIKNK